MRAVNSERWTVDGDCRGYSELVRDVGDLGFSMKRLKQVVARRLRVALEDIAAVPGGPGMQRFRRRGHLIV